MKAIRIGNDIVVRWKIFKNGEPAELSSTARHISVILSCRGEERRINDYVIDGNCIVFTFYGCEQKKPGTYRLTYIENEGLENMHTVDSCDAFILVETSHKVGGQCGCDNLQVESVNLTSTLSAPSDGLSAYEVALKNGFEGTEEEWLQSLLPDMTDIEQAEAQRQANEQNRNSAEAERQKAEQKRVISEQSREESFDSASKINSAEIQNIKNATLEAEEVILHARSATTAALDAKESIEQMSFGLAGIVLEQGELKLVQNLEAGAVVRGSTSEDGIIELEYEA